MFMGIRDLPAGVEGLRAVGKVVKDDYEQVCLPLIDTARRDGRRIRLLLEFGEDFEGFTPGAIWEDTKLGLRALRLFEGIAVVTDIDWIRRTAGLSHMTMPCPVRHFDADRRDDAAEWLHSLPGGRGLTYRIVTETGVLVAEITGPLRAQDFDVLSVVADSWIETRGGLAGIVVHARKFPGWENLGSFIRHIQFVTDHHREVGRVALAADGAIATLAPKFADYFVKAEVKSFDYDHLKDAIRWAGEGDAESTVLG